MSQRVELMKSWPYAVGVLERELEYVAADLRVALSVIPKSQSLVRTLVSKRADAINATLADLKAAHP